ncbi:sigma-70 family RNA polymerase sigma factor [Lysobacter psychrotolerans]|uniref:Sigma-70 family RNA polymerase sigma factor n=2 Tax=Montanilutibacter psychrotolerans TaxID=1327343 RepID=A0A3M8T650_9GAMM|nr:sigma-70 family RNA polymerase sigma factor [Lysobacter psychrotolerans]
MDGGEPQWIPRARAGDEQAFRRLVEANARAVFQLCFRITRDAALAEDAVQEAFYKAWRAIGEFDGRATFSTWLHRIAANAALEQLRRNARHRRELTDTLADEGAEDTEPDFLAGLADDAPGPEAQASGTQIGQRIGLHLDRLSPAERAAFVMRHCEGERLESIAAALSMNTGQCKQAIFRAVRKLRGALEPLR